MLPKSNRLSKEKEIYRVFRTKFRTNTQNTRILLSFEPNTKFKLLVVISKKVFKKANKRARLKRRISAIFEKIYQQNRIPPNLVCIVQVINKNLLYKKSNDIYDELIPTMSRLFIQSVEKQKLKNILPS